MKQVPPPRRFFLPGIPERFAGVHRSSHKQVRAFALSATVRVAVPVTLLGAVLAIGLIAGCSGSGPSTPVPDIQNNPGNQNNPGSQQPGANPTPTGVSGGSGPPITPSSPNVGSLSADVSLFPFPPRPLPPNDGRAVARVHRGRQSMAVLRVEVTDPASGMALAAPQVVPFPDRGIRVQFPSLRPGPAHVRASLTPDSGGSVDPMNIAQDDIVVMAGAGQQLVLRLLPVTLSYSLTPWVPIPFPDGVPPVIVMAAVIPYNQQPGFGPDDGTLPKYNTPVLYRVRWTSSDPTVASISPLPDTPPDYSQVQIIGHSPGIVTIQAIQPDTGFKATASVTVRSPTGPIVVQ